MAVRSRLLIDRAMQTEDPPGSPPGADRNALTPTPESARRSTFSVPNVSTITTPAAPPRSHTPPAPPRRDAEPRRDHVLSHIPRRVRRRAIHLRRILARERAAAMTRHPPIGIHDDLAARQPTIAHRTPDHKPARRIHQKRPPQLPRRHTTRPAAPAPPPAPTNHQRINDSTPSAMLRTRSTTSRSPPAAHPDNAPSPASCRPAANTTTPPPYAPSANRFANLCANAIGNGINSSVSSDAYPNIIP